MENEHLHELVKSFPVRLHHAVPLAPFPFAYGRGRCFSAVTEVTEVTEVAARTRRSRILALVDARIDAARAREDDAWTVPRHLSSRSAAASSRSGVPCAYPGSACDGGRHPPRERTAPRAARRRRAARARRVPVHGRPEAVETSRRGEDGEVRQGAGPVLVPYLGCSKFSSPRHLLEPFRASRLRVVHLEQLRGVAEREADIGGGQAIVERGRVSVKRLRRRTSLGGGSPSRFLVVVRPVEGIPLPRRDASMDVHTPPVEHHRYYATRANGVDIRVATSGFGWRYRAIAVTASSAFRFEFAASANALMVVARQAYRRVREFARDAVYALLEPGHTSSMWTVVARNTPLRSARHACNRWSSLVERSRTRAARTRCSSPSAWPTLSMETFPEYDASGTRRFRGARLHHTRKSRPLLWR